MEKGSRPNLVAECVVVQVVDVRHVDGILEDAPVVAFKLDLSVHWLPGGVLQLIHNGNGGPLVLWQRLGSVKEPDEATLQTETHPKSVHSKRCIATEYERTCGVCLTGFAV